MLACSVLEAALHVAPAYRGPPTASFSSRQQVDYASSTCFAVGAIMPILAEAAAAKVVPAPQQALGSVAAAVTAIEGPGGQQTAAGVISSDSSKLEQRLFCLLVAAVKYVQYTAALSRPSGSPGVLELSSHFNSMLLLCASSSAAYQALRWRQTAAAPMGGSQLSREQQLVWLQVLGRVLVAAGQLLQQVPQFVSADGSCMSTNQQLSRYGGKTAMLKIFIMTMQTMLQQGGAAAAAVEAGSPAAAATPADLTRLLQLAAGLQQQLAPVIIAFHSTRQAVQGGSVLPATQQLRAACQAGGLPQQLHSFGVACCAAFPQRGCCGNPACTNLDKFTETALASQGCSGCGKVSTLQAHRAVPQLRLLLKVPPGLNLSV
jgi:hypothetical protein